MALDHLELAGQPVRPGDLVVTLIGGANRDPEVYAEPGTFNIHREAAAEHLAFSSGIHYCLGQALARLEAIVALQMLAERMPDLALAGRVRRRNTTTIRGPLHLPVTAGRTALMRRPARKRELVSAGLIGIVRAWARFAGAGLCAERGGVRAAGPGRRGVLPGGGRGAGGRGAAARRAGSGRGW